MSVYTLPSGYLPAGVAWKRSDVGCRLNVPGITDANGLNTSGRTVFTTLSSTTTATQLNTAIQNCPAGQTINLGAGTFTLNASIIMKSGVCLNGAGPDVTILMPTGVSGAGCIMFFGNWTVTPSVVGNITAGFAQGSTVLTVDSSAGFGVGDLVGVDQLNDPNLQGAAVSWNIGSRESGTRAQNNYTIIMAISGNQITIDRPIMWNNIQLSLSPQIWQIGSASQSVINAGIQNMTVNAVNSESTGQAIDDNISFQGAYNCWVLNCHCMYANQHVLFTDIVSRIEQRHCLTQFTTSYSSDSYGTYIWYASNCLIEDNIYDTVAEACPMAASSSGNVFAYNFVNNTRYDDNPQFQVETTFCHGSTAMNLFEGNWSPNFWTDYTDNNQGFNAWSTAFRNRFLGQAMNNGNTTIYGTTVVGINAYNYYAAIFGNVLGVAGTPPPWYTVYILGPTDGGLGDEPGQHFIYSIGWSSGQSGGVYDPNTLATLIKLGNYNYFENAIDASETLSGQTLPASQYYTSKPPWYYSSLNWPWVDPTNATTSSIGSALPSGLRWASGSPFLDPTSNAEPTAIGKGLSKSVVNVRVPVILPKAISSCITKAVVHGTLKVSGKSNSSGSVTARTQTVAVPKAIGSCHGTASVPAKLVIREIITSKFAFVQTNNNNSGVLTSVTCPFLSNITLGNFIVVVIQIAGAETITSVTDSAGNIYSNAITNSDATTTFTAAIYYAPVTTGSGTKPTVTVNYTVAHSAGLFVYEFSGINNGSPIDAAGVSSGLGAVGLIPSSTSMAATSNPNDLIIGGVFAKSAITAFEPGWIGQTGTGTGSLANSSAEYLIVQDTGAYFATWMQTTSSGYTAVVASFSGISSSIVGGNSSGFVPLRQILRHRVLASSISSSSVLYVICQHVSAKTIASGTGIAETMHLVPATAKAPGISKGLSTGRLIFEPGPSATANSAATINVNTIFRTRSISACSGSGITRLVELRRVFIASGHSSGFTALSKFLFRGSSQSSGMSSASVTVKLAYRHVDTAFIQSIGIDHIRFVFRPRPFGTARVFVLTAKSGSIQEAVAFGNVVGIGFLTARPVSKAGITSSGSSSSGTDNVRLVYRSRAIASGGSLAFVVRAGFAQRPAAIGACQGSSSLFFRLVCRGTSSGTAVGTVPSNIRFVVRSRPGAPSSSRGFTRLSSVAGKTQGISASAGSALINPRLVTRRAITATSISEASSTFRFACRPEPLGASLSVVVLAKLPRQRITLTGGSVTISMVAPPPSIVRFSAVATSLTGSSILMEMFPTAQPGGDWAVGGVAGARRRAGFREVDLQKLPDPESGTEEGRSSLGVQPLPTPDE